MMAVPVEYDETPASIRLLSIRARVARDGRSKWRLR